jgi:hypothetical protein
MQVKRDVGQSGVGQKGQVLTELTAANFKVFSYITEA